MAKAKTTSMNTIPLLLLGAGAAYFLNKQAKSNDSFPPERPFRIIKTIFPGYEFKNNKLIVTDESKALTYVNKVAVARIKDYDRMLHCKNPNKMYCQIIINVDWIYYLGLDLFGFFRKNRGYADAKWPVVTDANIIKFDNQFKKYLVSDPDAFNYLVLNYIKYQVASDYHMLRYYDNWTKIYSYFKANSQVLLDWYKEYLNKLGLVKYFPTNEKIGYILK
jgi:hypothetical protein